MVRGQQQMPMQRARSTSIPELKQVIVGFGGRVVMRDTFEDAVSELLGVDMALALAQEGATGAQESL
ncbi:MAG: hypothetical protein U9N01_01805, partial [Euryarchaeota archaeon]|nr:hypothetical protein [Euryarchaeota archaeon]